VTVIVDAGTLQLDWEIVIVARATLQLESEAVTVTVAVAASAEGAWVDETLVPLTALLVA